MYVKRADKNNSVPPGTYFNLSIVDTGYTFGQNLTEEQKADVVRIALNNKSVQDMLNGTTYFQNGDVRVSYSSERGPDEPVLHVLTYPYVDFETGTFYEGGRSIDVSVDVNKGKVIRVMSFMRTPILQENQSIS